MIDPAALLRWYQASGVTTAEASVPTDFTAWPESGFRFNARSAPAQQVVPPSTPLPPQNDDAPASVDEAVRDAQALADAAQSIEGLAAAIEGFDGCLLKSGARNTVVYDGVPKAPLLVIGEAPGRDEDRIGKPFVGRAGGLLDKMLAAIEMSRFGDDELGNVCITNAIYWRPPGNRTPTKAEIAVCLPFVRRFIALSQPRVIALAGNVPTSALFPGAPGITRSRGQWREWPGEEGQTVPVLPIFHPAFLLRQPAQKRLAWADLIAIKERLA